MMFWVKPLLQQHLILDWDSMEIKSCFFLMYFQTQLVPVASVFNYYVSWILFYFYDFQLEIMFPLL